MADESSVNIFFRDLMRLSSMSNQNIDDILSDETCKINFIKATTHKSYNYRNNLERFEFKGDCILNSCVVMYMTRRFPLILSRSWLTRLKHYLISATFLRKIADKIRIVSILRVHESYTLLAKEYGDSVEAAIGVICENISIKFGNDGFNVAYQIIEKLYNAFTIELNYYDIFDINSFINEYKSLPQIKSRNIHIKHTKRTNEKNECIYSSVNVTANGREITLPGTMRLRDLASKIEQFVGVKFPVPDPYESSDVFLSKKEPDITPLNIPFDISDELIIFVKMILERYSNLKDTVISKIIRNEGYLTQFARSLRSEYIPFNNSVYSIQGIPIIADLGIGLFLYKNPGQGEGLLSIIKQQYSPTYLQPETPIIKEFNDYIRQERYRYYAKQNIEYKSNAVVGLNVTLDAYRAFVAVVVNVIDDYTGMNALGLFVAQTIVHTSLQELKFVPKTAIDKKSQLTRIYANKNLNINDYIEIIENKIKIDKSDESDESDESDNVDKFERSFTIKIYFPGYPKPIAVFTDVLQKIAMNKAVGMTLTTLETFGIQ